MLSLLLLCRIRHKSIHSILINKYGLPLTRISQSMEAIVMSREIAGLFNVDPGYPAFHHTKFGVEDIDGGEDKEQRHTFDVKKRDFITLNLDYRQMGVGGDTSWGARTHKEYTLPAIEYSYSFRLRPFSLKESLPTALSKQKF